MADNFRLDGKLESGNVAVSVKTEESPRYSFTGKFTFPSLDVGKSIAGDEYYFSGNIENDRLDVAEEEVSDSRFEFGIELHRKTLVVMGSAETGDGYEFSVDFGGPQVDLTRYYTKEEIDLLLREKADKANTLAGFNIRDAYISEDTIHLGTSAIKIPPESGGGGTGGDSFFELVVENGTKSVRLKEEYSGLWTTGFLSVRGKDDSGSAGGGGSSLSDIWASLNTNTDAFRDVKINSGHIPALSIDKIAGLQEALDDKLGTDDLTTEQWAAINSTITEEKLAAIEKITALFNIDSNGDVFVTSNRGFYSNSFISARGKDSSGSAGGGSADLQSVWESLRSNTDAFKSIQIHQDHIPALEISRINGLTAALDNNVIEAVKLNQNLLPVASKTVNINAATSLSMPEGLSAGALTNSGDITISLTSGYVIPKEERLLTIEEITSLFAKDANGDVYITGNRGLYSNSFISARGKDSSGSSSGGADLQTVWASLSTNTDAYKNKKIDVNHIPDIAISNVTGLADYLNSKVDKEEGKGLSSNDYTDTDKIKLTGIETGAEVNKISSIKFNGTALSISSKSVSINAVTAVTVPTGLSASALSSNGNIAISLSSGYTIPKESRLTTIESTIADKVDKIDGKGLSTNDFTDAFKTKLTGIEDGAEVNKIASVKLNGTALAISSKAVNVNATTSIAVPAAMSSSALSTDGKISLSLKSGYTIPTESRLTAIEKITALFGIDADGNVYVTGDKGFYSNSFVSARGKDSSGGTGGGGSSLEEVWASLTGNTDAYKDSKINLGHIPAIGMDKVTGLTAALLGKADRGTTLAAYGIGDAYTADETDALLAGKSDTGHKHSAADITSGTLALDRIPTIPYSKTSGVQAALVSGTSIKTINGVSILGSGNIVTPNTTYSSKAAASGGTDLSLVTTGEKYTWNAKQAAISDLATIRSNATDGATAYGWGDHSKAGYLKSIANLTINGTLYDGTNEVTINTPTYTLSSFGITASAAELNYSKGVTSAIQTQLDAKASSSHTHTFTSLTSKPTTLAGYGITDALGSTVLFSKQDYQRYVLLLCRIGANTTIQTHTINGTFWTEAGGGTRYQAAYINVHCGDWTSGHNEYYGFTPFGIGIVPRLVTCTYNSSQYLAVTFENVHAVRVHFDGSSSNILFTPVLYYTSNTQTVNNSEIYNSIADVQYNKIPLIPSADTVYHTGNLTKSSIGLGNVENTAFYRRSTTVNGTVWDMAGTTNSSAFSIYAPTSAGTSGQVLCSTGGTPSWVNPTALTTGAANSLAPNRYPTSNTSNAAPLLWFTGQPAIGTTEGCAYKGSSNDYNLWSYPEAGTSSTTSIANIQTLRLSWDKSKYWHDIFASPNGQYLWHRNVQNGNAGDWHRIVEETSSNGWHISITGNAATATKLATARTLWGQSFDGSGNVSGHLMLGTTGYSIMGANEAAGGMVLFQDGRTVLGSMGASTTGPTLIRSITSHILCGSSSAQYTMLDSGNYSSYALPLTGGTLTGNLAVTGNINASGTIHSTTGVYSEGFVSARGVDSSSDGRLKTDIKPLENALQYVLKTKYRSFRWKSDGKPCIGVIAQEELGREHGYLVEKHKEYYSYNYAATTALIGAALQEEDRKVEALKKKIAELESEVRRLRGNNS